MRSQLRIYAFVAGLFSCTSPAYTISTSNAAKLTLKESCPVLPEKTNGENFAFKLQHLKQPLLANRFANIWYDPAKNISGQRTIVFYWHGTDGVTEEIDQAFGQTGVKQLVDRGYVVVSPDHIRDAKGNGILKYSWYIANGSRLNYDVVFGDLIVQCLNAKFGTDFKIITTGCSAGAMQSALWAFQNKDIVGMILYSGGIFRVPKFVPRDAFWAVITHGGVKDARGDFNFMSTAIYLHKMVVKLGYPSALCDFTPLGHDIHTEIANILPGIVFDQEKVILPVQCKGSIKLALPGRQRNSRKSDLELKAPRQVVRLLLGAVTQSVSLPVLGFFEC